MNYHPLAEIFPLMQGKDFEELVEDIRANGVREPVWTYQGQILDGRNRFRAAKEAGREAPVREFTGEDPVAFVISLNLHRRHLNESQRSIIAGKLATLDRGRPAEKTNGPSGSISQEKAADLMNVGQRSVKRARKVIEKGAPEVVQAVERGEVKVSAAAAIVDAPMEQQAQAVAKGAKAVKELQRSMQRPRARTVKEDLVSATKDVMHFVEVLRVAKIKAAKFIFEPYGMNLMDPEGDLVPFVAACGKAVAKHRKKVAQQMRKCRTRMRAQRKQWAARAAKERKKAAAARKKQARTTPRKAAKAAKNAGRVSARQRRHTSSGANRLSHASSRGLKRSSVTAA
jgi:ParB-like chromosome segregation protein Spo0J